MMAHHTWAIVLIAGMMKVRAPAPTSFRNGPTTLVDSRQLQAPLLRHAGVKIHNLAVSPILEASESNKKKKKKKKKEAGRSKREGQQAGQRPQREHWQ